MRHQNNKPTARPEDFDDIANEFLNDLDNMRNHLNLMMKSEIQNPETLKKKYQNFIKIQRYYFDTISIIDTLKNQLKNKNSTITPNETSFLDDRETYKYITPTEKEIARHRREETVKNRWPELF